MSRLTGLWRHPDFLKLWSGDTISQFGSQVTLLALPLTAVLVLNASPSQMGLLSAIEFLPFLLVSLFAGVWADRLPRRPILITADIGRAIFLGSVPVVAFSGWLSIEYLYMVAFLTGIMTVFFDVAYQSYLPSLVERENLVEGNSKLEVSRSIAQIAGPGLAGTLVQLITAPFAILVDAVSFLVSAVFIGKIKKAEPKKLKSGDNQSIWSEIGEGMSVVFKSKILRSIAGCTATSNLFWNLILSIYTLFMVRELNLSPALIGLIYGIGSFGGVLGALIAGKLARKMGLGPTIIFAAFLFSVPSLLIPLAGGPEVLVIIILIIVQLVTSIANPLYNVNQVSLRQAIIPTRLQGRMNASIRFIIWGTIPVGSLLGGYLGESIGLRPALWIGAIGSLFCVPWVYFSPVRHLKEQPEQVEDTVLETA